MINILVTGSNGQLGHCLKFEMNKNDIKEKFNNNGDNIFFLTRNELDITDYDSVYKFVLENNINVIINCAAYTKVDDAEDHYTESYKVNSTGPKVLSKVCYELDCRLIHISTDYVFDGKSSTPYCPDDRVDPKTHYGGSKSLGESSITLSKCAYMIIRTSWLYSTYGKNFFNTMLKLTKEKDELNVVFDQVGSPTFANDLARFILIVIEDRLFNNGIYHFSNRGVCSWYDFAYEICRMSNEECNIIPCLSKDFPTKAHRPNYSVLDCSKTENDFNYEIPNWKEALERCFNDLKYNEL